MKNFTKQNFKTNPLWVRLLIMTCMLLAGSSSAWAASLNTNAGDNRASGVEIQYNSTSKWYRIGTISNMWNNGCTPKMSGNQNNPLDGHKFGTITTLKLKGGEVNTRLNDCNSGCGDYAEARYSYKIYKTNVSEPSNYTTGFTANTWECGSRWDNASDVSIYNSADINLLSGLGAGDYNLKMKMDIQARWSGGTYGNTWSHTASATFTVPGYSTTTGTLAIGEVNIGSNKSSSKAMTHYGSTTTATAEVSGTNANEFKVTSVSATSVTVEFTPTSAGSKTATVTVTDAYSKTYTLTVTGTGKQACEAPTSVSITRGTPTTGNICQGSRIDLTANVPDGSGDITYSWTKTSGSSNWTIANASAQKCTVTVGTGSATFQISAKRCNTTKTATVTLTADATPAITLKAGPTICSGTEVTFASYVDASSIGEITWHTESDFSDAAITSAKPNATTTYYAKATNGVCSTPATASLIVTVKSAPTKPVITLNPTDGKIVSGGGVSTSATLTVTPQDDVTFTLYKDGESTGRTENPFDNITEAGEYYVIGTNTCGDPSPASDSKTITVCTIGSTLDRAEYDPATQKVNLEGTFEVCGKNSFYGFQWRKVGSNWCDENQGNENSNYVTLGTTTESATKTGEFSLSSLEYSYEFRTYVVPVGGSWVYGNVITVYPCINIATPDIDPVAICSGSAATLTLNNKQNGVTYTLDGTPIFTDGTTHTVKPDRTTTYTITATSTNSCDADQTETTTVEVEVYELPDAPTINEETTVCPNTAFELPSIGDGKWYAQEEGGAPYASTTITNGVAAITYYYAEAVKYGCSSATRTKYTVNVHTAPVAPLISLNPVTVGQDKNSVLSISNETYSPSNTKYELYKGSEKVGEMTAQTTNVSSSDVGNVKYTVKATHKECAALTSTSNEVTLTVQEAGAIIAALGDLKVDPQDPVDFVAMYVKNDGLADYTDKGATKVTGYTWQFYNDDDKTWMDCASTNAVAGATYSIIGMENGSKNCNNFRPSAPGKYRCKVTYDKGEQTSNVLTVTGDGSTAKTFKGVTMNIPVISVNTGKEKFPTCDGLSGTASKNADVIKEKISVDVKIFAKVGENIEVVYDRKARMNYRGSSSLNFVKKSYAFCTGKEKTKNDKGAVDTGKENLFGLSNGVEDKDWVLYAAAADPSIMRNRLMLDTFRDMTGGWSVNSMYVELVVNGEYKGVYVLMDKITANMGDEEVEKDGRVEVEWKLDKQGNTTQEGFIVKFDKTDIVDRYENTSGDQKTFKSTYSGHDGFTTYDTQIDQRFEIEYPEKEDIEEEDLDNNKGAGEWSEVFNTIKEKFNKFEYELAKGNFTEVQKLIDYTSWADWFIITEFGKNIDGYRASNLFVYDGSKPNAKIEARPLWDQELSFDNQCPNYYAKYGANNASGFMLDKSNDEAYNNDASTPFWFTGRYTGSRGTYNGSNQTFKGLLDDPCFVAMVKTRWAKHKADALSQDKLNAKVTAYTKEMGAAKDREATFWSTRNRGTCQCSYSGSTGYEYVSFDDSKKAITEWIKNRPAGLTTAIEALKGFDLTISLTVTPDGGEITPWEAVMVKVNNPSGYDYDLNYTTNTLDKVEGVIISENNDKYTYRIPRPSTWGTGDGERAAIEYGIQAILNVSDDNLQCGTINEELTKADVTITLKDEEDDDCSIVEP